MFCTKWFRRFTSSVNKFEDADYLQCMDCWLVLWQLYASFFMFYENNLYTSLGTIWWRCIWVWHPCALFVCSDFCKTCLPNSYLMLLLFKNRDFNYIGVDYWCHLVKKLYFSGSILCIEAACFLVTSSKWYGSVVFTWVFRPSTSC